MNTVPTSNPGDITVSLSKFGVLLIRISRVVRYVGFTEAANKLLLYGAGPGIRAKIWRAKTAIPDHTPLTAIEPNE